VHGCPSTGVAAYDDAVKQAVVRIEGLVGRKISPRIMFMDADNAYYDNEAHILAFGRKMIDTLRGPEFALKVSCIAAHEICHSFQLPDPYMDLSNDEKTVRANELMADTFAGYILAMIACNGRSIVSEVTTRKEERMSPVFKLFFDLGDSYMNDRDHHGTSEEREETIRSAYEGAYQDLRDLEATGDVSYDLLDAARVGLGRHGPK
jgi:hypothetical protein